MVAYDPKIYFKKLILKIKSQIMDVLVHFTYIRTNISKDILLNRRLYKTLNIHTTLLYEYRKFYIMLYVQMLIRIKVDL